MQRLLTPADAARILDVTPAAVRAMECRGELCVASRTERGSRLFRRIDVERLARRRQARRSHGA